MFRPYRDVRKLTMFGSARTRPSDPVYMLARDLAAHLAEAGWMVVTGAGPGSWRPASRGPGATLLRGQHPAPLRAGGQPVHRPGPQARRDAVLLHPQADADQGVPRLRGAARAASAPWTSATSSDPAPDRQGRAGPGGAGRDRRAAPTGRAGARSVEELPSAPGYVSPEDLRLFTVTMTASRRRPTRSSTSTATTTRAAGWATCWCCACRWRRAGPSWPSSTGASPTSWSSGSIRHDRAASPRALRRRPLELPRVALRFDRHPLRAPAPADRRPQPVHRLSPG